MQDKSSPIHKQKSKPQKNNHFEVKPTINNNNNNNHMLNSNSN